MKDIKYSVKEIFRGNWVKWLLAMAFICCGGENALARIYYSNLKAETTTGVNASAVVTITGNPAITKGTPYHTGDIGNVGNNRDVQVSAPNSITLNGDEYIFSTWDKTIKTATTTFSFSRNNNSAPTHTAYYSPNFTKYYATFKAKRTDTNTDISSSVEFTASGCSHEGTLYTYKLDRVTSDITQTVYNVSAPASVLIDGGQYKFDRWSDGNTNQGRSVTFSKNSPGPEFTALYKPSFATFSAKLTADTKDGEDITSFVTFSNLQRNGTNIPKDANNVYSFKSTSDWEASQNSFTISNVSVPATVTHGSDEYQFRYWSDGNTNRTRSIEFTKDGSTNLQAIYAKMCTLTIRTVSTCQGKRIYPTNIKGYLSDGSELSSTIINSGSNRIARLWVVFGYINYSVDYADIQFKGECGESIKISLPGDFEEDVAGATSKFALKFSFSRWLDGSGVASKERTLKFDDAIHEVAYDYEGVVDDGSQWNNWMKDLRDNVVSSFCDEAKDYVVVLATVSPYDEVATTTGGYTYEKGSNVTLTATPKNDCYQFEQWYIYNGSFEEAVTKMQNGEPLTAKTPTGVKTSTMTVSSVNTSVVYIANFTVKMFEVRSSSDTHGKVTIKQDETIVDSGSKVDCGSSVVYEAIPTDPCYEFDQWSDGRTLNPRTFTVRDNINISASFKPKKFNITTSVKNNQNYLGDVLIYDVTDDILVTDGRVTCGHQIRLTPNLKQCGSFVQWGDGNKDNPRVFTASKDESFEAEFSTNFTINVTVEGSGSVLIRDCAGNTSYQSGTNLNCNNCYSVTAMANGCSIFLGWEGDLPEGQEADDEMLQFTQLTTTKNLKAKFSSYQENLDLNFTGESKELTVCKGDDLEEPIQFKSEKAVIAFGVKGETDGLSIIKSIYDPAHDAGYVPCSSSGVFVSAQANLYDRKLYITLDPTRFDGFATSNVSYYHFTVYDEDGQIFDDWGSNVGPGTKGPFPSHRQDFDFTKTYTLVAEMYNNQQGMVYTESVTCESKFTWAGGYIQQTDNGSTLIISGAPTVVGDIEFDITAVVDGCSSSESQKEKVIIHVKDKVELSVTGDTTQTVCSGTAITPIEFTTNVAALRVEDLPAGLSFAGNKITGTPTASGKYVIVAEDANYCGVKRIYGTITVNEPSVTLADIDPISVCKGNSTKLTAEATAVGDVTYLWSSSSANAGLPADLTTSSISVQPTSTSTYKVVATATQMVNGVTCSATSTKEVIVTVNPLPTFTTVNTDVTCHGSADGTITVTAADATPTPISYSKDNGANYQTGNMFSGLSPETYSIVVKDGNGCVSAASAVVITEPASAISGEAAPVAVTCKGLSDGSVTITAAGGNGGYTYKLGDGEYQTSNAFSGLSAGDYTVNVKDSKDCNVDVEFTITEPEALQSSITSAESFCFNKADGVIKGTFEGGQAPYNVSWTIGDEVKGTQEGVSNINIENLPDGTYTVTVTDKNGCHVDQTAIISELKQKVVVTANSDEKTYDGTPLINSGYTTSENLEPGDAFADVVVEGTRTDVGTSVNKVTSFKIMRGDQDVTCYYDTATVLGNLIVTEAAITLTCPTEVSKIYDATAINPAATASGVGDNVVTIEYKVEDGEWSTVVPSLVTVDTVHVYVRATAVNHNAANCEYDLQIDPAVVNVTITKHSKTENYDGLSHTVSGYDFASDNELFKRDDLKFIGTESDSTATGTEAGKYGMKFDENSFENLNPNFENIVITIVEKDSLEILPIAVDVIITKHGDVAEYDGKMHSVSGYDFVSSNELFSRDDFKFIGDAADSIASGTNAGHYGMAFDANSFENVNKNFGTINLTIVEDDSLIIKPITVHVSIVGAVDSFDYDGMPHTVSGYDWSSDNDLYNKEGDFSYNGDTIITETDPGVYTLTLDPAGFVNNNPNFTGVTFDTKEIQLTINHLDDIRCPGVLDGTVYTCVDALPAKYASYEEFKAAGGYFSGERRLAAENPFLVEDSFEGDSCMMSVYRTYHLIDARGMEYTCTETMTIMDTVAPQFLTILTDTIIACDDTLFAPFEVKAVDNCDNNVKVLYAQNSNKGNDPGMVNFYNYEIERVYTAIDRCGNESVLKQIINVRDTLAPKLELANNWKDTSMAKPVGHCVYTVPDYRDEVKELVSDNCVEAANISVSQSPAGGSIIYESTDVWIVVEDVAGNRDSVTKHLRVQYRDEIVKITTTEDLDSCVTDDKGIVLASQKIRFATGRIVIDRADGTQREVSSTFTYDYYRDTIAIENLIYSDNPKTYRSVFEPLYSVYGSAEATSTALTTLTQKSQSDRYYFVVMDTLTGCSDTAFAYINVVERPKINVSNVSALVCEGVEVDLDPYLNCVDDMGADITKQYWVMDGKPFVSADSSKIIATADMNKKPLYYYAENRCGSSTSLDSHLLDCDAQSHTTADSLEMVGVDEVALEMWRANLLTTNDSIVLDVHRNYNMDSLSIYSDLGDPARIWRGEPVEISLGTEYKYKELVWNKIVGSNGTEVEEVYKLTDGTKTTIVETPDDTTFYFATITDGVCPPVASKKLEVRVMDLIPTAFTPHTVDGMNDVFMKGHDVVIYNRYGNKIFEGNDGWPGTYKGDMAEPAVYYYEVVMKDGTVLTGSIEIVKLVD